MPVRRTFEISEQAHQVIKKLPKQLGLTQFEFISLLIETADINNPMFVSAVEKRRAAKMAERNRLKTLKMLANGVSDDDLDRLREILLK